MEINDIAVTESVNTLTFLTQSEIARDLKVSRQAVSKKANNPIHRARLRFDSDGRICLQDYINLEKLSPGRKAKNAINSEVA